jgi:hypothetical protein
MVVAAKPFQKGVRADVLAGADVVAETEQLAAAGFRSYPCGWRPAPNEAVATFMVSPIATHCTL